MVRRTPSRNQLPRREPVSGPSFHAEHRYGMEHRPPKGLLWDLATGKSMKVRRIDAKEILKASPERYVTDEPTAEQLREFARSYPFECAAANAPRSQRPPNRSPLMPMPPNERFENG